MSEGNVKTKAANEWPATLNPDILSVIRNEFKFTTMTPVQVNTGTLFWEKRTTALKKLLAKMI